MKKSFHLKIDHEIFELVKELAEREDRTINKMLNILVEKQLKQELKKAKQ